MPSIHRKGSLLTKVILHSCTSRNAVHTTILVATMNGVARHSGALSLLEDLWNLCTPQTSFSYVIA
jgi:hypothetical protein